MATNWNAENLAQYSDITLSRQGTIDALLAESSSYKWGGATGTGTALTYSFPGNFASQSSSWASGYSDANEPSNLSYFNATLATAVGTAPQTWAAVANLSFTQVVDAPSSANSVGILRFAFYKGMSGYSGWAYSPGYQAASGDVWLNPAQDWSSASLQAGKQGFGTLLHEIGHALGLSHPEGSGTAAGYDQRTTAMSYNNHPYGLYRDVTYSADGRSFSWSYEYIEPETPMLYDIAAIQYVYGANTGYRTGNDTYTFDPATPFIKTLWDAGGTDTISVANFSRDCLINLRAGCFSSINVASDPLPEGYTETHTGIYDGTDNLAIAYGVVIENATGGAGNDRLRGNSAANVLDGGAGSDTALFSGGQGAYSFSVLAGGDVTVSGTDGTDTLRNIEILRFDSGSADLALMTLLPTARLEAQPYYAKVQAYFLAMAGRAAAGGELAQYASLLAAQTGSVWKDGNGATATTGSLVGALNASPEFSSLTAGKSTTAIVGEMFQRLTGTAPGQAIQDYYVSKLAANAIKLKGLANAMLNDLAIMPTAGNTLSQPANWTVKMFDSLAPADYIGYLGKLELVGINVANLDASGNLA